MPGPLEGVRVVELSTWGALPGGGAILSDWGADVIKIEEPSTGGDPARAFGMIRSNPGAPQLAPLWEQDNRNKKSVTIDIGAPDGREVLRKLIATADVFISSTRPKTLEKWGLSYQQLAGDMPRLVFLHLSGFGPKGPDSGRPGYDALCFWSRSGLSLSLSEPGQPPVGQRPALGDHTTSIAIAAGVAAALFARERTGKGQMVQACLLHTGLWVTSVDVLTAGVTKQEVRRMSRKLVGNPLTNTYKTADGWIHLVNLQSDRFWEPLCRAVARPEVTSDPRYNSFEKRAANGPALVELFEHEFVKRTTQEWIPRLDAEGIRWGKVQNVLDAASDEQVVANSYLQPITHLEAGPLQLVTSPVQFSDTPATVRHPAPQLGEHTEQVLLDLGYGWDDIGRLKNRRIVL